MIDDRCFMIDLSDWYPGKLTERQRFRAVVFERIALRQMRSSVARFERWPYRMYRRAWLRVRLSVKGLFMIILGPLYAVASFALLGEFTDGSFPIALGWLFSVVVVATTIAVVDR